MRGMRGTDAHVLRFFYRFGVVEHGLSCSLLRFDEAPRPFAIRTHASLVIVKPRSSLHRHFPAGAAAPPAVAPLPFSEYLTSTDPDKRQKAENWRFAIGLQRVDGLSVSPFLVELARKNIEGLMTNEEVQRAVRAHYSKQPKSPNP